MTLVAIVDKTGRIVLMSWVDKAGIDLDKIKDKQGTLHIVPDGEREKWFERFKSQINQS